MGITNNRLKLVNHYGKMQASEIAKVLGVSIHTVYSWLSNKRSMPDPMWELFVLKLNQ